MGECIVAGWFLLIYCAALPQSSIITSAIFTREQSVSFKIHCEGDRDRWTQAEDRLAWQRSPLQSQRGPRPNRRKLDGKMAKRPTLCLGFFLFKHRNNSYLPLQTGTLVGAEANLVTAWSWCKRSILKEKKKCTRQDTRTRQENRQINEEKQGKGQQNRYSNTPIRHWRLPLHKNNTHI